VRQWVEQAARSVLGSPFPVPLMTEKLRRDASLQPQWSAALQDVSDKVAFLLMLVMKQMDGAIEEQTARVTGRRRGATSTDAETQKLQRMVQKRSQMYDALRGIIDKHNETAKGIIQSIGR